MHKQDGSLHVVVIGALSVLLVAAICIIFVQNFGLANQPVSSEIPKVIEKSTKPTPTTLPDPGSGDPLSLVANTTPSKANIWAGYVVDSASFASVEGRIKVPKVNCTFHEQTFGAWVGFDGWAGSQTVEQTGVNGTCENASRYVKTPPIDGVYYYAWAAMHGAGSYEDFTFAIKPGDIIFYRESFADGKFTAYVKNETTGESGTNVQACSVPTGFHEETGDCPRKSAEWIVERPGANQLPNFGNVTLYDNKVTTEGGKTGYIEWFHNVLVDMYQGNDHLSNTTDLLGKGSFKISWLATGKSGD